MRVPFRYRYTATSIEQVQGGYFTIARASKNTPGIPPSSLMSFLKERPSIPGVVIAEHNEHYLNK
jgi:hypothetical protein